LIILKNYVVMLQIKIDDAALGCPLIYDDVVSGVGRAYVDWKAVEKMLEEKGILTKKSV